MDINYRILWFEDQKDWFDSIRRSVESTIRNYLLKPQIDFRNTPEYDIQQITSQNYDLILVDYTLSSEKTGDEIIKSIREGNIYVDVIFYSADEERLKTVFKENGLEGVYINGRDKTTLVNKINQITAKNLKRTYNPVNLRGIVMDSTSEFDSEINDIILKSYSLLDEKIKNNVDIYLKKNILDDSKEQIISLYDQYINDNDKIIEDVITKHFFDSYKKAKLLNKILSINNDKCDEMKKIYQKNIGEGLNFLENYNNDVIKYRNALAHSKKNISTNNTYIGTIDKQSVIFDDKLCKTIRKNLLKYDKLFKELYNYIENE